MIDTYTIFPTPLKRVRDFITDGERQKIIKLKNEEYVNAKDNNLRHTQDIKPLLETIKRRAEKCCISLGEDMFGQELEWKITSMWKNTLEKNGYQYVHNHSNSFISGIIYVNLPEGAPITKFYKPEILSHFIFKNHNLNSTLNQFNCEWIDIPETMQLDMVLFPSYIKHSVDKMEIDAKRITLSFNAVPQKLSNGPYDIEFKV